MEIIGPDRIMYSVDYPYYDNKGVKDFIENAQISQVDKEKIAYKNVEKLLKL
ncbi:amidohydrolase family protein [Clostridium sp. JS66]|nr:amidohydrolase family protein [Clostridium sp. JS66]